MLLNLIFFILFFCLLLIVFLPNSSIFFIRQIGLICSSLVFLLSLLLIDSFCLNLYYFQNIITYQIGFDFLNLYFTVGLDGVSLFFFLLSSFLIFLCVLFVWDEHLIKEYILSLLLLDLLLLLVFSTLDILFFYILFESILIPMFIYIGKFGVRNRKIEAAFKFFVYTYTGSLIMFLGIIYIYYVKGTLDLDILYITEFTKKEEILLWLSFFASFAVKIPIIPFHIWLPEAHVEAPTAGSVLLAGILLKLGIYGFVRYSIPLFPYGSIYFLPLIYTIGIISIIYSSLSTIRQIDLKKIIAYASIGHMNFVLLGLFSQSLEGLIGSLYIMLSHGFISSGLFITIGVLYDRHHSRILYYYRGLTNVMPLFALFFFLLNLANLSFPGTSSFIGEFLILLPLFELNPIVGLFTSLSALLSAVYSIWLINRIIFGSLTMYVVKFNDLFFREFSILLFFTFLVIFFGLSPHIIFNSLFLSFSYYFIMYF